MREKPVGEEWVGGVQAEQLFQLILFYDSASNRRRRHWNSVWKQLNRIVNGPGQENIGLAFSKTVAINWPVEKSSLQFRGEFYNALNHPQFSNPDANFTSPTFGVITSTAVNPRVAQLALRFGF